MLANKVMPELKPEIRRRLTRLQLAPTRENAIVEELAQHLDEHYAESLASGMIFRSPSAFSSDM
jgi:hypothetical protein